MKTRRNHTMDSATPNLTPMIDVTFQLLVFFLVCVRFTDVERNHRFELPLDSSLGDHPSTIRESLTIYCDWDAAKSACEYALARDGGPPVYVEDSRAGLTELVATQSPGTVRSRELTYARVREALIEAIAKGTNRRGSDVEKLVILNRARSESDSAPWIYVALAIDAAAFVNEWRGETGRKRVDVCFGFLAHDRH